MKRYKLTVFFTLLLSILHNSYAQDDSVTANSVWIREMNTLMRQVPDNVDSVEQLGKVHIEECPFEQNHKRAYYHSFMAEVYYYRQHIDLCLRSYQQSLNLFISVKDSSRIEVLYNNIGLLHYLKANYDSALVAYNASLEIELRNNNREGIAQSYQNLGIIYGKWARYAQVLEYYNNALTIYQELKNYSAIADVTNNMAVIAVRMNDFDLALNYYKKAFEAYRKIDNESGKASVASNLGRLFFQNGQNGRAKEYFNVALEIFHRLNDKIGLVHTYSMMGEMYLSNGEMDKALSTYQLVDKYNEKIGLREVQLDNLKDLYIAYKELRQFELANEILEKSYDLKDSIYTNEQFEKLLELEKKYHAEKSQKELILLRSKEERNRLYLWGLSIFFLFLTIIVLIWVYVLKIKEKQRRLTMEHKVLRTQMNPHFIFNSLSALQCIILENNKAEAMDFVADFSGLMRLVLQYAKEEQITLKKEKEILENYMSLQNRRFDNKISYKIDFDDNIQIERVLVPPMLTQPFLENAIEHGQLTREDSYIHVKMRKQDNKLEFSIEDNGVGIKNSIHEEKSKTKKHKSIALGLTQERLRLLNDKEKDQTIRFKVEDLSDYGLKGTRVVFEVPYRELN